MSQFYVRQRAVPRHRLLFSAIAFALVGAGLAVPSSAQGSGEGGQNRDLLVALGDSYTSGVGNLPYEPASDANGCDRSPQAYPLVAAESLDLIGRNVACSGATTAAIEQSFKGEPAQASRLEGAEYVALTIGGNDVEAFETLASGLEGVAELVAGLGPKLAGAYDAIEESAPNAEIFVLGYPDIFPDNQAALVACLGERLAGAVDIDAVNDGLSALNKMIEVTATASGVHYVDTSESFEGHDFCSTEPFAYGLNVSGGSFSGTLHPNVAGQKAMAADLVEAIEDVRPDETTTTSTTERTTSSTQRTTTSSTATSVAPGGTTSTTRPTTSTTRPTTSTSRPATSTSRPTSTTSRPTTTTSRPTTTTSRPTTTTSRPTTTTSRPATTTSRPTTTTSRPGTTVASGGTTSTTRPTTTTTRPGGTTSTTRCVPSFCTDVPAGGVTSTTSAISPRPPAGGAVPLEDTEVLGEQIVRDDVPEVQGTQQERPTLAFTGSDLAWKLSLALMLTGFGLALSWARLVVNDRAARRPESQW